MKTNLLLLGLFSAFSLGGCEDATELPSTTMQANQLEVSSAARLVSEPKKMQRCASAEMLEKHLKENPGFALQREAIEEQTRVFISAVNAMPDGLPAYGGPVTIPVVVHVLYNTAEENISDEQIASQIDVLNKDFNAGNEEVLGKNLIPEEFRSRVANVNINFILADVNRKETNREVWMGQDMKFESRGGINAWDPSQYLNLWVCNLSGGLLGFATFPGGPASTDGVVVTTKGFGDRGILFTNYNKGRTATHEVGHWLNLYHIWRRNCDVDDLVEDTPNAGAPNFGCPTYPSVSCSSNDMTMNYMDYTYDACMYMFSKGQKDRMRALFVNNGPRSSFVQLPNPVSQ